MPQPLLLKGPGGTAMVEARLPLQQLNSGGQVITRPKFIDQDFWDTEYFVVAGGAQRIRYFTSRNWQFGFLAGTQKTQIDNNMESTGGIFNAPQSFTISAFQATALTDLQNGNQPSVFDLQQLRSSVCLSFIQGEKNIWQMPIERIGGPGVYSNANAAAVGGAVNLTSFALKDYHKNGFTIALAPGLNFSIELTTSVEFNPSQNLRVRVKLIGTLSRSIR